jgi:hypothetical protein
MKEPIHNQVAQDFLPIFLEKLTQNFDAHTALFDSFESVKRNLFIY